MADKKELTAEKILDDFTDAYEAKAEWLKTAKSDIEFTYGDQWDESDVQTLQSRGVRPLSINKIKPKIQLITGIESQNRSEITCYPEGGEDQLKGEVSTALVAHVMKQSNADYKVSEMFELSLNVGEGFIEPYVDYTHDIVNGELKFKVREYDSVFYDPNAREYDLSDAKYICVLTQKLTEEDILEMFPDKEELIEKGNMGRIDLSGGSTHVVTLKSYDTANSTAGIDDEDEDAPYDVLEYYYKKMVRKIYVADRVLGKITEASDDNMAAQYEATGNAERPGSVKVITRYVPEIWKASVSGSVKIDDKKAWVYPGWKAYPLIPCFCYRAPGKMSKMKYSIQGIPRGLRDLNIELNKRRTQELHILNTSANSGWQYEMGTLNKSQEKAYQEFGSSPGVLLEHMPGHPAPVKIMPTPLSQGHAQLAQENTQDIKEASGINDDMLAMNEQQSSGRAIMLRQKQGMVMIQKVFDNLSQTKRLIGRFILSQLGKIFDVETAMRVMGEQFCRENFSMPQPVMTPQGPAIDPMTGQPVMQPQYDESIAKQFFNELLTDTELGKYDVAVGESAQSETVKFANFMTLKELAAAGIPVPPEIIVEESTLSSASKEKIRAATEQMQMQQQQMMMAAKPQQGNPQQATPKQ